MCYQYLPIIQRKKSEGINQLVLESINKSVVTNIKMVFVLLFCSGYVIYEA